MGSPRTPPGTRGIACAAWPPSRGRSYPPHPRTSAKESRLFDAVRLRQVVPGAQKLDVLRHERRAAPGVRKHVIEVEVVLAAASDASPGISFPHSTLHFGRDHPVVREILGRVTRVSIQVVDELKPELEHS